MIGIYLAFFLICSAQCATKSWKAERSDWQSIGYNPECAEHILVYQPKGSLDSLIPTSKSSIDRIVLPEFGAIVIQDDSPITLRSDEHSSCPSGWQNYKKQVQQPKKSWYSPDMWTTDGERFNAAKPHVDRIPCECDTASISTNSSQSIGMSELDVVVVKSLLIDGQSGSLKQLLNSELGTIMLGQAASSADAKCSPRPGYCGCHNPIRFESTKDAVCDNVQCVMPSCLSPVQPIGHCCAICGAVLQTTKSNYECRVWPEAKIEKQMHKALHEQVDQNLLSHVQMYENFYPNLHDYMLNEFILQLVLVDRGDSYEEYSPKLASLVEQHFRRTLNACA